MTPLLNQITIASPCSADWEQMEGDDRVRFCSECKKNVFNLSAMTRRDAETLLRETNGNLCTRLFRRTDGTVLTADCPVGIRLKIARVSRRLGWAIAGAMSLSTAFAQQGDGVLSGVVKDPLGSPIRDASVTIINERTGEKSPTRTDETGHFRVSSLNRDFYKVSASSPGFSIATKENLGLRQDLDVNFKLLVGSVGGPVIIETSTYKARSLPSQPYGPKKKPWWRRLV